MTFAFIDTEMQKNRLDRRRISIRRRYGTTQYTVGRSITPKLYTVCDSLEDAVLLGTEMDRRDIKNAFRDTDNEYYWGRLDKKYLRTVAVFKFLEAEKIDYRQAEVLLNQRHVDNAEKLARIWRDYLAKQKLYEGIE